jgi:hypothetical protein
VAREHVYHVIDIEVWSIMRKKVLQEKQWKRRGRRRRRRNVVTKKQALNPIT